MKSFFSEWILTKDGNIVSNTVVKKYIKNLIDKENKKSPLTDKDLALKLVNKDYVIARRTVTKYRESMKISIARLRKQNI